MLKQMNEEQLIQYTGGAWWNNPCDSWWGCEVFALAVGGLAALATAGAAGVYGAVLGSAACNYICKNS